MFHPMTELQYIYSFSSIRYLIFFTFRSWQNLFKFLKIYYKYSHHKYLSYVSIYAHY